MVSDEPYQVSYYVSLGQFHEYTSISMHNRENYLYILDFLNKQLQETSRVIVTAHEIKLYYNHLLEEMTTSVKVITYHHKLCENTVISTETSTSTEPCGFSRADNIRSKFEQNSYQLYDFDEVITPGVQRLYGLISDCTDLEIENDSEIYEYIDDDADYYDAALYESSYDSYFDDRDTTDSYIQDSHPFILDTPTNPIILDSSEISVLDIPDICCNSLGITFDNFDPDEPVWTDRDLVIHDFFPCASVNSKSFIHSVCEGLIRFSRPDHLEHDTLFIHVLKVAILTPVIGYIGFCYLQLVKFRIGNTVPRLLFTGSECLDT